MGVLHDYRGSLRHLALSSMSFVLAPIKTFDPTVFEGDAETPQSVCDFVLELCLVHND